MSDWLPVQAAAHAGEIDRLMTLVHLLMAALFAGWGAYFVWALVRFRSRRNPTANAAGTRGRPAFWVEAGVVAAEAALLVGLALPLWFERTSAEPAPTDVIVVRVVAEQFAWNAHYPGADGQFGQTSVSLVTADNPLGLDRRSPFGADDIWSLGELHLPVHRAVVVQLSSKDVIHSFGVPAMRVKQDAIPGLLSPVRFTPTMEGRFDIACSQLCGVGHHRMRGLIVVESEEAFAKWLASEATRLR